MADPDKLPDWMDQGFARTQAVERGDRLEPQREPMIGGTQAHTLQKKAENAKKILICDRCEEWYDYSEDWESCPKCEAGLMEMEKA